MVVNGRIIRRKCDFCYSKITYGDDIYFDKHGYEYCHKCANERLDTCAYCDENVDKEEMSGKYISEKLAQLKKSDYNEICIYCIIKDKDFERENKTAYHNFMQKKHVLSDYYKQFCNYSIEELDNICQKNNLEYSAKFKKFEIIGLIIYSLTKDQLNEILEKFVPNKSQTRELFREKVGEEEEFKLLGSVPLTSRNLTWEILESKRFNELEMLCQALKIPGYNDNFEYQKNQLLEIIIKGLSKEDLEVLGENAKYFYQGLILSFFIFHLGLMPRVTCGELEPEQSCTPGMGIMPHSQTCRCLYLLIW